MNAFCSRVGVSRVRAWRVCWLVTYHDHEPNLGEHCSQNHVQPFLFSLSSKRIRCAQTVQIALLLAAVRPADQDNLKMNYSRKSSPLRPLFPISMHWLFVSKLETLMESVQRLPRRAASSSERSNSLDELSPEYYFCRKTSSSSPAQTRVVSFAIQMQINELIFKFTNSSLRCQAKSAGQVYLARLSVVSGALWCTDLSQKLIVIHNLYEFIIRSSAQTVPPLSSSTLGQALHFRTIPFAIEADDFTKKSR